MPAMRSSSSSATAGRFKAGRARDGGRAAAAAGRGQAGAFRRSSSAGEVKLAVGDTIRITANGRDATGKHRVDNGRIDTIARLHAGAAASCLPTAGCLPKDFAHLKHGLVSTSPAAQSKDKAHTWQQLNRASLGAVGAEQFLVSLSRGKQQRPGVHRPVPR